MTREEAIERLKNMAWLYGSAEREQNIEAIDMAIEALQREEAEEKGYCHRIRPKGEWIEAEPSTSDHVLVTYRWGDDCDGRGEE